MRTLWLRCNQCSKEAHADVDGRFWHRLQLHYPNADSIPASVHTVDVDFCSRACLRVYVEGLKGE